MAEIHSLVRQFGRDEAKRLVPMDQEALVDVASRILSEQEHDALQFSYSGFCLTALPHRNVTVPYWEKDSGIVKLIVEPGTLPINGKLKQFGIPFGARARLILLYLQTRALQTDNPVVEVGANMNDWLARLNISRGGSSYKGVREQAHRLSACRMTFTWKQNGGERFERANIVDGGFVFADDADTRQNSLWQETVRLSPVFFRELQTHPVPIWEPAIRELSNNSMGLDVYTWLAYRLRSLGKPITISWPTLQAQFGSSYNVIRSFRNDFRQAMALALTVYPDARVTDEGLKGVMLYPSPSPVPEKTSGSFVSNL